MNAIEMIEQSSSLPQVQHPTQVLADAELDQLAGGIGAIHMGPPPIKGTWEDLKG